MNCLALCGSGAFGKTAGVQQINKPAAELPAAVKSIAAVKQKYIVSISLNKHLLNTPRTDRQLYQAIMSVVFSKNNCSYWYQLVADTLF